MIAPILPNKIKLHFLLLLVFSTTNVLQLKAQSEKISKPEFSHQHGFFEQAFDLEIMSKSTGASIKYTLDGSDPRLSETTHYSSSPAQIRIDPTSTEGRGSTPAVVIRACAFRDGYEASKVVTQTYIFTNQVKTQTYPGHDWPEYPVNDHVLDYAVDPEIAIEHPEYADQLNDALLDIPSISIVTDNNNLFSSDSGIYVNPRGRGRFWERTTSVELINPDNSDGFQVDAGIRIRGGYSRQQYNPKHAFRLFFRKEYGESKLKYPLFNDEGVNEFDNIDLRTSQNYSWAYAGSSKNTFVREVFSRDVQRKMNQPYTRSRYYHLYLNGLYWGLFQTQERSEASYAESYFGDDKDDYDVVKVNSVADYTIEATDGNMEAWTRLYNMAVEGFETDAAYYKAQGLNPDGTKNSAYDKLLDIDNLIDYMITTLYTGDGDGPISAFLSNSKPNNFYAIYNRKNPDGFKFFRHDAEHSMGSKENVYNDRTGPYTAGSQAVKWSNPQYFHQQLVAHPDYVARFTDRVNKHMRNNGILTPDNVLALLQPRIENIQEAIIGESARWGDSKYNTPYTKAHWLNEISQLTEEYVPLRTDIVIDQFKAKNWFPELDAPLIEINNTIILEEEMLIDGATDVSLSNPNQNGILYYSTNGNDPRLPGGAIADDAISAASNTTSFTINETGIIKIRIKEGNNWSAIKQLNIIKTTDYSGLMVSELHYNPTDMDTTDGDFLEFIELKNTSNTPINLTLCSFSNGIKYAFNTETTIGAGEFIVLAANKQQFMQRYNNYEPLGEYNGQLSNGGETIALSSPQGNEILSVKYNDKKPWPEIADGIGFSLVAADENSITDPSLPEYWSASSVMHGTPGYENNATEALPVLVNEVFSRSEYPNVDAIELYNPNNQEIDISHWYISDNFKRPTKWQIPENTMIAANGYFVIYQGHYVGETMEFSENEFGSEFSFSSHGESAYIFSANLDGNLTGHSHGFSYEATDKQRSFARHLTSLNEEHFVLQDTITLEYENTQPYVGSVIINKIMYHPSAEGCEFIELLNTSNEAVNLFDPAGSAGNWELKGLGFDFPDNTSIQANANLYLISDDYTINEFRLAYGLADSIQILRFDGGLKNDDETLALIRPSAPYDDNDEVLVDDYIEDKVSYKADSIWPVVSANGYYLQRVNPEAYGNDPANWIANTAGLAIAYDGAQATEGVMFYTKLKAIAGTAPYSWQITNGSLPENVVLNETTGSISGMPTTSGVSELTIEVTDANANFASQAIVFEVIENSAPIAVDDSFSIPQNRVSSLNILSNDIDIDGDKYNWEISIVSQPANGSTTIDTLTHSIIYTPNLDFDGDDLLVYQISYMGNSSNATVNISVEPFSVSDFNALVAIYNALDGDNWRNNTGWNTEINNVSSEWNGISVRDGRVVGLSLVENNLSGSLPPEIGDLTALEYIELIGDPNLNGSIPKEIGKLNNLYAFIAYANGMSGEVPSELGQLTNLQALILGMNNLSGTIPPELGYNTGLIELYIFDTNIGGDIPNELTNLENLQHLWLANNYFTSLPDFSHIEFADFLGPEDYSGFCVRGNNLGFDDIEPNLGVLIDPTSYSPQRIVEIPTEFVQVTLGGELSISFEMEGLGNEYQWFMGITAVSEKSPTPDLFIANISQSDLGRYKCKITNPSVPSLTLSTSFVEVSTEISTPLLNNKVLQIYSYQNTIYFKASNGININGLAEVYDLTGKKVLSKNLNGVQTETLNANFLSGAYIVKFIGLDRVYSQKIILR